jgi:serine/threonine protein kinase
MVERNFGPYRLVQQIAVGGMAEIYLAQQIGIGGFEKHLALKVIHPNFAEDEHFIKMLIDEAKIAGQLQHVNIGQIIDLGQIGQTYYIAMEFVDGRDLFRLLRRASEQGIEMPIELAAYVAREVCAALDYAHNKQDDFGHPLGIIHRDISPQNVLISYSGEVKLVDFGIAKAQQRVQQTAAGVIKGKYYYMSPEQAWGDPIDHRTDVFSTGIVLYEMLVGQMLYLEDNLAVLLDRVRKAEIAKPRALRKNLPPELEQIVMKALERKPDDRFQTAHDFGEALQRFLFSSAPDVSASRLAAFIDRVFAVETERPANSFQREPSAAQQRSVALTIRPGGGEPPTRPAPRVSTPHPEARRAEPPPPAEPDEDSTQVNAPSFMLKLSELAGNDGPTRAVDPPARTSDGPTRNADSGREPEGPTRAVERSERPERPERPERAEGARGRFADRPGSNPAGRSGRAPVASARATPTPTNANRATERVVAREDEEEPQRPAKTARPMFEGGTRDRSSEAPAARRSDERRNASPPSRSLGAGMEAAVPRAAQHLPSAGSLPFAPTLLADAKMLPKQDHTHELDAADLLTPYPTPTLTPTPTPTPTPLTPTPPTPDTQRPIGPPASGAQRLARSQLSAVAPMPALRIPTLMPQEPDVGGSHRVLAVACFVSALALASGVWIWRSRHDLAHAPLRIDSTPRGATVTIDGRKLRDLTPITVTDLPRDRAHEVVLTRQGFIPYTQQVASGEDVYAALLPDVGVLRVQTDPPGAELYINNRPAGNTPITVKNVASSEDVKIEVRLAGFRVQRQTLSWEGKRDLATVIHLTRSK